jgi:hypothetical protein
VKYVPANGDIQAIAGEIGILTCGQRHVEGCQDPDQMAGRRFGQALLSWQFQGVYCMHKR